MPMSSVGAKGRRNSDNLRNRNFNFEHFVNSALAVRGWTELRLAKESGLARSVVSEHISGARSISQKDLMRYMKVLNHQERPMPFAAWLRDSLPVELVQDLLNVTDDLAVAPEVTRWLPMLDEDSKQMLNWCAREIARDPEFESLFKLISVMAGYRPRQITASPAAK